MTDVDERNASAHANLRKAAGARRAKYRSADVAFRDIAEHFAMVLSETDYDNPKHRANLDEITRIFLDAYRHRRQAKINMEKAEWNLADFLTLND